MNEAKRVCFSVERRRHRPLDVLVESKHYINLFVFLCECAWIVVGIDKRFLDKQQKKWKDEEKTAIRFHYRSYCTALPC